MSSKSRSGAIKCSPSGALPFRSLGNPKDAGVPSASRMATTDPRFLAPSPFSRLVSAHAVSITAGPGSAGLEADHRTVWVCKNAGSVNVWATLRFNDGSLKRYDGPLDVGFCRNHGVSGTPTGIRLCWGNGQNTCTAFKDA